RVVLPSDALFSHATAARLWRMPLPARLDDALHVLTPNRTPVRRPGVIAWTREGEPAGTDVVRGLPVTTVADTWVSLATMTGTKGGLLTREWLVAIGDFLVSGRRTRFGREPALASLDDLADAVERHGSRRGAVALNWALTRIRSPVDSPRRRSCGSGFSPRVCRSPMCSPRSRQRRVTGIRISRMSKPAW